MKQSLMASATSFAHLIGRTPKAAKAEDDDDKRKTKRAEEDRDEKDDEGDEKKGGRAEETERDEKDDDEGDEEDDDKKGKKSKAKGAKAEDEGDDRDDDDDGDDDSDGADMQKKGARSARMRERARCAAIFADKAAGGNPALAATLAFGTDLPRSQAVAVLRAGGTTPAPSRKQTLDERMSSVRVPVVGASDPGGAQPDGPKGVAAQIIAAGKKRRAEA